MKRIYFFFLLKLIVYGGGMTSMLFSLLFSLLSVKELQKIVREKFWQHYLHRFLLCFFVGLIFWGLSSLLNLLFRKQLRSDGLSARKIALWEFVIMLGLSIVGSTKLMIHLDLEYGN